MYRSMKLSGKTGHLECRVAVMGWTSEMTLKERIPLITDSEQLCFVQVQHSSGNNCYQVIDAAGGINESCLLTGSRLVIVTWPSPSVIVADAG